MIIHQRVHGKMYNIILARLPLIGLLRCLICQEGFAPALGYRILSLKKGIGQIANLTPQVGVSSQKTVIQLHAVIVRSKSCQVICQAAASAHGL